MCQFFSCISDGKGNVHHFDLTDIVNLMTTGNPKNYQWNSHTSIASFTGLTPSEEDKVNKWEYDPDKKTLNADNGYPAGDDSVQVKAYLNKFFEGKDIRFLQNLYNQNSGDRNSGSCNSGDCNSGNRNSGDRNSGSCNSGNGILNSFCTKRHYFLFDKSCTKAEYKKIQKLPWDWFSPNQWVDVSDMTEQEKTGNPTHVITGGILRVISYKEAWAKCPKDVLGEIKKLKNFSAKKFEEISGVKV